MKSCIQVSYALAVLFFSIPFLDTYSYRSHFSHIFEKPIIFIEKPIILIKESSILIEKTSISLCILYLNQKTKFFKLKKHAFHAFPLA